MKRRLDYSEITHGLIVGKTPYGKDYQTLQDIGVDLAINMRVEWPIKLLSRQQLIQEVWLPSVDSRYFPINQKRLLKVATKAKEIIDDGGKVYVYCREGRHRSVVMATVILIMQGYSQDSIRKLISIKRPISDMRAIKVASTIATYEASKDLET